MSDLFVDTLLFHNDNRSLDEKLRVLVEIGSQSPEALTLSEVKFLCRELLSRMYASDTGGAEELVQCVRPVSDPF